MPGGLTPGIAAVIKIACAGGRIACASIGSGS